MGLLDRRHARTELLLVSHGGDFDGGAECSFREGIIALRQQRPDVGLVAVYPWAGPLAAGNTQMKIETVVAPVPRWAYFDRVDAIHRLQRAFPLSTGTLHALALLWRRQPAAVVSNTMVISTYAVAAKILRIPHYWVIREFGREDHGLQFLLGYKRTIRLIGRLSTSVICVSRAVEATLLTVDPNMSTKVVYPGVDAPSSVPASRSPGEPLRAVLVGRFTEAKGQDLAVRAVAAAASAGVPVQLSLVGPGDPGPVRRLAEHLNVADLVSCHGATHELLPHWRDAHVALMCSRAEAFGRVTVEAMKAGLPVCGTDSGGTCEIVKPGINGLLSPVHDFHALAANLMALERDEHFRRRLAIGAVKSAERFTPQRFGLELAAAVGL